MVVDHALTFFLVVFAPVLGRWSWRRLDHALSRRRDDARLTAYSETMVAEWTFAIGVLVLWISSGRLAEDLGLAVSWSMNFFIVTVIVVVLSIFLLAQARSAHTMSAESGAILRRQMESVEQLLPHSAGERSVFMALSVTAGFCEELLYRGFLIGYLAPFAGMVGAVAGAAIIFGLAHVYQGVAGVLKTGAIGLVMGVIYAVSGSIWPAILLHIALDIQGGMIGYALVKESEVDPLRPSAL